MDLCLWMFFLQKTTYYCIFMVIVRGTSSHSLLYTIFRSSIKYSILLLYTCFMAHAVFWIWICDNTWVLNFCGLLNLLFKLWLLNLLLYLYLLYGVLNLLLYLYLPNGLLNYYSINTFSMVHRICFGTSSSSVFNSWRGINLVEKYFKKSEKSWRWLFFKFENPKHKNVNALTFLRPCVHIKKIISSLE